jgi:cellulose biosynthesis protein BcsQ
MKIVVLNSKGGVGKSTISIQVASAYIFSKTGKKISHYEFDDENQDSMSFRSSEVMSVNASQVARTDLRSDITDIILEHENLVLDIGANKTTVYFLEALIDSGMIHAIDLFIIPLMDGENDALSAVRIYHLLKDIDNEIKVLFALNRVNSSRDINSQFNIFLGDNREVFNDRGVIEEVPNSDREYIKVEDSDAVKYSKNFGMTIYELANLDRDLGKEIRDAIKSRADKQVIKVLSFKKFVKDSCKDYLRSNLEPIFSKLDRKLKSR